MDTNKQRSPSPKKTAVEERHTPLNQDEISDIFAMSSATNIERLMHQGREYAKLMQVKSGLQMTEKGARKRVNIWLCVEISGQFPARPVLVPEIVG